MRGKRLQKWMKELLEAKKLNPENWLYVRNLPGELHLQHRATGRKRVVLTTVRRQANESTRGPSAGAGPQDVGVFINPKRAKQVCARA